MWFWLYITCRWWSKVWSDIVQFSISQCLCPSELVSYAFLCFAASPDWNTLSDDVISEVIFSNQESLSKSWSCFAMSWSWRQFLKNGEQSLDWPWKLRTAYQAGVWSFSCCIFHLREILILSVFSHCCAKLYHDCLPSCILYLSRATSSSSILSSSFLCLSFGTHDIKGCASLRIW